MARDVEIDITAKDKTSAGLTSAEKRFKQTNDRIKREQDKSSQALGKGLLGAVNAVSPKLASSLAEAMGTAGRIGAPALAAGVAAGAPLIGAAVSGAILAGAGAGAAGIGVAIAAQDVRVRAAANSLWEGFENRAIAAGGKFVGPTLAGIDRIDAALNSIDLDAILGDSARFLPALIEGAASAVEDLGDGFEALVHNAGPAVDALADGIAEIGRSVGEGLESLADNGESSADALRTLLAVVDQSVDSVFRLVNALTEAYEIGQKFKADFVLQSILKLGELAGANDEATDSTRRMAGGTFGAAEVMRTAAGSTETYTEQVQAADRAARDLVTAQTDLYSSTTTAAGALANANKTIRENGRTLSLASEKGRENRDALSQVAGALRRQHDATVAANGVGRVSAQVAQNNRNKFVALAQKAGLSADAAGRLATKLGLIPSKRETQIRADTAAAEARVKALQAKLNGIRDESVRVNVIVNESRLASVERRLARINGGNYAAGGSFGATAPGQLARTGGPVQVNSTVQNTIMLDGRPFRAYTDQTIARERFRDKVGRRVS